MTSFIVRDLGWQARNRFLGYLPEMKTIRLSGWLEMRPMAFLDPSAFYQDLICVRYLKRP
jgi:hypothetical protein